MNNNPAFMNLPDYYNSARSEDYDKTERDPPKYKGLCQLRCHELVEICIPDLREDEHAMVQCYHCEMKHPLVYNSMTGELKIFRKNKTQTGKNIYFWKDIHYRKIVDWEVY